MKVVVITGMSGAGKSSAIRHLEDMGYFCIDNLPPQLLPGLLQAFRETEKELSDFDQASEQKLAVVTDVRSAGLFGAIAPALQTFVKNFSKGRIIFLEASDQAIVSRYKQSRRNHPLAANKSLIEAIKDERINLEPLREIADTVIDTTEMRGNDLRIQLDDLLNDQALDEPLTIFVQSFGFKYGIPLDCDNVIDVRFITNPFYYPELRDLSGLDDPVRNYVLQFEEVDRLLNYQHDFYRDFLPFYQREGKVRLTIGVGCTGGRHRSVALAEELGELIRSLGYRVLVDHRDLARDPSGGL